MCAANRSLRAGLAGWLLPLALTPACDHPGCDNRAYVARADGPLLTRGELVEQAPDDPWTLIMAYEFRAPKGDLDDGQILLYTGTNPQPTALPLERYLRRSEVPLGATQGRFGIDLTLADGAVQDGVHVRVGAQVANAAGERSNCYQVDLFFDVRQALARLRAAAWRLAARPLNASRLFL